MTNNITATVNGVVFSNLTIEQAQVLAGIAAETTRETQKPRKGAKAEAKMNARAKKTAKADEKRAKHDAILDSKRVERMTKTAVDKLVSAGFEVKTSKQGKWVWVYPCGKSSGKGRTPEFKGVKLAKGWNHSMKRGAFFRDFS